jgi:outer membrane protein OmpA-like peptidoglycan-associated protein/outer membrane protein assembly factor BamB
MKSHLLLFILLATVGAVRVQASDWPVFKGNIYYTGNNDDITVKNSNLKWLFQASDTVYNTVLSDGMVYFVDVKKNVYCLDEDSGRLKWRISLKDLSAQFSPHDRSAGKVKYPLVRGDRLILSDNFVIYCLNKHTGKVLWARTGMREEKDLFDKESASHRKTPRWQPGGDSTWDPGKYQGAVVDGIYSDPVINGDMLYYGTRNVFISREISKGHIKWDNGSIQSYSGFPSFYDRYIFTQSMDYLKNIYSLICLDAETGAVKWSKRISKPVQIFSPVVYRGGVYLANGSLLLCFNLADGSKLWERDYSDIITSNPSFTERSILFTIGNREVAVIDPTDGKIISKMDLGEKSSPYYVTIRDQVYIVSSFKKKVGGKDLSYASLKALQFDRKDPLWQFVPPFPGGGYQPAASNGIMFLPAGNYLYAVGTDYYPRIIEGGSAVYDPYNRSDYTDKPVLKKEAITDQKNRKDEGEKKPDLRKMKITVTGEDNAPLRAQVEIRRWDKGKLVFSGKGRVQKPGQEIEVPDTDDVEVTADADGFVPQKAIISKNDKEVSIKLEKIEKGRGIIVENIHFEIDSAYLKKESLNVLDRMIDALKRNTNIRLEVRGHTDSTGPRDHNVKLSEKRADAVKDYMVKNGISPERLSSSGYGPDRPVTANDTASGRSKNRRTEFFILDK